MDRPAEPFELVEHLGTGGFAHTYHARVVDPDLAEDFGTGEVALKIPLNRKKEMILRHELELNAGLHLRLKELDAANIVRYLGFAVFRNQIVMAMEYMPEGSLRGRIGSIGKQRPLPASEGVTIAKGILRGMNVIHRERVFHRDIKPENILMAGGEPKIADLGIARMLNSNELASSTVGTIYYMSPEILSTEGASFPSDIWSLGVTLYEMVTGKLPFGSLTTPLGTMADLIRGGEFVPACETCDQVPPALSRIIGQALTKEPTGRFASAEDMLQALERFERGSSSPVDDEMAGIRELAEGCEKTAEVEGRLCELVARYPGEPKAYQYLGEFLNRCQRHNEALAAFAKGLVIDPENPVLHWDLALAHQRIGNRTAAAQHLETALKSGLDASHRRHAAVLLRALKGGGG